MKIEVVKEIRFAVVMYGGVSLAIYINGVAQELLRMVRATTIDDQTGEFQFDESVLDETEKSYRTLSYLLGNRNLLKKYALKIKDKIDWKEIREELNREIKNGKSAKIVRFVVDIMSGSSAGGINAIYLSKALVNGQDINKLEKLWIDEGNFSSLLNDAKSVSKTKLILSKEPPSLFNSQRMYLKLLEAFETMDDEKESSPKTSMVEEVDLFVTLTDFWGLPIPVRLFDKIIYERNHRRRLHFKYRREGINDFQKQNYPFLAYAARCTSSFPVAFDPMKLSDANKILKQTARKEMSADDWKYYFPQEKIRQDKDAKIDWENRVFVDGGTLDNKPFGYAIEALARKQANVLIDRKLIYIEPKPDLDGGNQRISWTHRPDAFKNTVNSVTTLPGYETIREDLHQVLERNRLIGRVNYIVSNARKDEYRVLNLVKNDLKKIVDDNSLLGESRRNKDWAAMTLAEIARDQGQAVYAYYRLRLSALTDDLARLSTRRAGFDDDSDYFLAIRSLVRYWRLKNYNKDENEKSQHTIPTFLYEYDFNYRFRRLRFVLQQADRLLSALDKLDVKSFEKLSSAEIQKDKFAADLKSRCDLTDEIKKDADFQAVLKVTNAKGILRQKFPLVEYELFESSSKSPDQEIFSADKDEIRLELRKLKEDINKQLKELDHRQQLIETRLIDKELPEEFKELNVKFAAVARKINVEALAKLLGGTEDQNTLADYDLETANKNVEEFFKSDDRGIEQGINEIAQVLRQIYNGEAESNIAEKASLFGKLRKESKDLFADKNADAKSPEHFVRGYLRHFYENFDSYDQIIFPITFETPIGEGDMVEVARISPADAVNLINEEDERKKAEKINSTNEKKSGKKKIPKKKLAGDTFFSFSAFFNEDWRKNDIMWGRLDAAERVVEMVTPNDDLLDAPEFKKIVITEIQRQILEQNKSFLTGNANNDKIDYVNFIKHDYAVNRNLDENSIMKTTARALAVTANALRSRTEKPTDANGLIELTQPNMWLARCAGLINSVGRMIEISSYQFSSKEYFSFLMSPFRLGWLVILLLILLVPPTIIWILIFNVLRIFDVLKYFPVSEINFLWLGGAIFVIGVFYILLFGLMYGLKHIIFRRLAKAIIAE